jgi:uncharacterized protein YqeY
MTISKLEQSLKDQLKECLKARNKEKLDVVRGLLSAFQYEAMEKKVENLTEEQGLTIVQREIKKRREELEFADKANRPDLKEKPSQDILILESLLPTQLSKDAIGTILTELKASTPGLNMGAAMKLMKEKYAGQYDGKIASEVAKGIFG